MAAETIGHQEPEGERGTSVAVVFHSASGHVRKLAHHVGAAAAACSDVAVDVHDIEVIDQQLWDALARADAIVFGCPTYMGGPSSVFKAFAEASLPIWASRGWSGKVAAGFTHSQAMSGDKLNTLQYFSLLAAQHGMLWTNVDLLPGWCRESDLLTAEHLGARVAENARALRSGRALLDHYDSQHVVSHTATEGGVAI